MDMEVELRKRLDRRKEFLQPVMGASVTGRTEPCERCRSIRKVVIQWLVIAAAVGGLAVLHALVLGATIALLPLVVGE